MDDEAAWDLECEMLSLVGTGAATIAQMQRLCSKIAAACADTPQHVRELARLPTDSHRERDLHAWVDRQTWRSLLPEPYVFNVPLSFDGGQTMVDGEHAAICPHDLFSALYQHFELFQDIYLGPPGTLERFWSHYADIGDD